MEVHPMKDTQRLFMQGLLQARKSATITSIPAQSPRPAEEQESFTAEEKEGFRFVLIGGCWRQEAEDQLTRRASYANG